MSTGVSPAIASHQAPSTALRCTNGCAPLAITTPPWPPSSRDSPWAALARAEEIADLVVTLASPVSAYMTGQCVTIDGGMSL